VPQPAVTRKQLGAGFGIVALLALVKVALNLATWERYGFHRDEWYYIMGGLHLALGYVDHPPLTPLLAGLIYRVFGLELIAFRLVVGLAGIDLLGDAYELPEALTAHNSYYYWGPDDDWETLITVGYSAQRLSPFFATCERVATISNRHDIDNDTHGYPIMICRDLTVPRAELWEALKHFQ
jgi:hypothetical protein